jgi:hypothetical protein
MIYEDTECTALMDGVEDVFEEDFISVPREYPDLVIGDELTITFSKFKVIAKITEVNDL